MEVYHRMDQREREPRLGCCGCLEKWFLGTVNLILFIVAVALMSCGVYVMTSKAAEWMGTAIATYIVVIGVSMAFIAFLGCCGALRESKCMLWLYAFLLFWIILSLTVGLTICAVGENYTKDFLSSFWDDLSLTDQEQIQDHYKCCSFDGNSTDATTDDKEAYKTCLAENPTYVESCWEKAHGDVSKNLKIITVIAGIVVAAQILFLFMTMALINGISMASVNRRMSQMFSGI